MSMRSIDQRPILVCRLECPAEMLEDVDGWMPKHFDDSLLDPHVLAAANYAVRRDFRAPQEGGLPSVFNGHGNRFIVYVAESIESYLSTIDSDRVLAAIADGSDREARYPAIDDEPFNGVVYAVREVRGPIGEPFGQGPIVIERFERSPRHGEAFDAWLDGPHLGAALALPGARRVRTWSAYREYPERFPYDRYRGKGDRMIWIDFEPEASLEKVVGSAAMTAYLDDSVAWDVRLPYVRREMTTRLVVRMRSEALAARGSGTPDG